MLEIKHYNIYSILLLAFHLTIFPTYALDKDTVKIKNISPVEGTQKNAQVEQSIQKYFDEKINELEKNTDAESKKIDLEIYYNKSPKQNLELYAMFFSENNLYDVFFMRDIISQYPDLEIDYSEVETPDDSIIQKFIDRIFIRLRSNPKRNIRMENIDTFFQETTLGSSLENKLRPTIITKKKSASDVFSHFEELKVVTASRSETSFREAPSSIYVITSQMIKERGYRTVMEALQDVPGFQFQRTYGANPDLVHQRGLIGQNQRSLLYIDGQPDNNIADSKIQSGSLNYPLHNVKQIEVVAGPASALYGANAFNGIINVISKQSEGEGKLGHTNLTYGTWNKDFTYTGWSTDFAVNKRYKRSDTDIGFSIAGSFRKSDGPDFRGVQNLTEDFKGYWWSDYYNSSREEGFHLNARFFWNNFRLNVTSWQYLQGGGTFANGTAEIDTNQRGFNGYQRDFRSNLFSTGYLYEFNKMLNFDTELKVRQTDVLSSSRNEYVYFDPLNDGTFEELYQDAENAMDNLWVYLYSDNSCGNFGGNCDTVDRGYARPDVAFELSERINFAPNNKFVTQAGIEYADYSTPAAYGSFRKYKYKNIAAYAQQVLRFFPSLTTTLGLRFDHNTIYGDTYNPRISTVYTPTRDLTLKGFASTGFRAPTPSELFFETSFSMENPSLQPEKLFSAEVGGGYRFLKNNYLNLTTFYNKVTNVILEIETDISIGQNKFFKQFRNIGSAKVYGLESTLDIFLIKSIKIYTGYTYTLSEYVELDPKLIKKPIAHDSKNIPGISHHVLQTGITWYIIPTLSWNLRGNFVGRRNNVLTNPEKETPGYGMLHTNIHYFNIYNTGLSANLSVRNILDVKAWDPGISSGDGSYFPSRHPLEGRNIWFTIGLKF